MDTGDVTTTATATERAIETPEGRLQASCEIDVDSGLRTVVEMHGQPDRVLFRVGPVDAMAAVRGDFEKRPRRHRHDRAILELQPGRSLDQHHPFVRVL